MKRKPLRALVMAAILVAAAGCSRAESHPSGCFAAADAAPVDTAIMAFLSMARALHHEADLAEGRGDSTGAIDAMRRLVTSPSPPGPEADEVLADAYARIAELHLQASDLERASKDVQAGLERAHEPTYFRGHLLEVGGLVEEARVHALADAGKRDEADRARARAVQMLDDAVRIQQTTIERALSDGGRR
jgi:tetratricopeptide (TPR) repeat protein